MVKIKVGGILEVRDLTMISILGITNDPGSAGQYLKLLGDADINLHFISEGEDQYGSANIAICVDDENSEEALAIIRARPETKDPVQIKNRSPVTVFIVYGPHFRETPAICSRLCYALGDAAVNILGLSSSISSVCCIIDNSDYERAYASLLTVFDLP